MMATFAPLSEQPIRLQPLISNSGFIFYSRRVYPRKVAVRGKLIKKHRLKAIRHFCLQKVVHVVPSFRGVKIWVP